MVFPTIPANADGTLLVSQAIGAAAARTFPNLSSLTKNSGDLLIAVIVAYQDSQTDAAFSGWPGGWTEFHDSSTSSTMAVGAAYKWSDGTEAGTFTITQAATITGDAVMFLMAIPGAHPTSPPEAGGRSSGNNPGTGGTAYADPGALDPAGWNTEDTLWIAVAGCGEISLTGTFTGVAATNPANYTGVYRNGAYTQDAVGGVSAALAFRQLAAASEDPGAFSNDNSYCRVAGLTIAVRPAPPQGTAGLTGEAGTLTAAAAVAAPGAAALAGAAGSLTAAGAGAAAGTAALAGGAGTLAAAGQVPVASHITYRAAAGSAGVGSSATVALPAGWQAGDMAMVALTVRAAGQAPACAGWDVRYGDGNGYTWVTATRVLAGGDTDPVFTWSQVAGWDAESAALAPDTGYSLSVAARPAEVSAGPGTQVTPPAAAAAEGDASVLLAAGRAAGTQTPASYGMTSPAGWSTAGAQEGMGGQPSAPFNVTSITSDAGAMVSFRPPADPGGGPVTHFIVTPYIGGAAQSATTVTEAAAGSITGSDANTYRQVQVSGLANGTAYTFKARARNAYGDGPDSAASGANTPLSGLVFGDDFNGPAGGPIDPEWWVYDRCGYLAQAEVAYYKPSQVRIDGGGCLELTAEHISTAGPRYPSDPAYPGTVTQPWRSGAVQGNTRTFTPAAGNTMTFEAREQVMADVANGYWPGLFWLEGQSALTNWKTDPAQGGWNATDHAEIDVAEWIPGQAGPAQYVTNTWTSSSPDSDAPAPGGGFTCTVMHVYSCRWKPGLACSFWRDGVKTHDAASNIAAAGAQFVLLLYLQMLTGGPATTESCLIDYIRVYDQNLG